MSKKENERDKDIIEKKIGTGKRTNERDKETNKEIGTEKKWT